jgi:hypothetical protein
MSPLTSILSRQGRGVFRKENYLALLLQPANHWKMIDEVFPVRGELNIPGQVFSCNVASHPFFSLKERARRDVKTFLL